MTRFTPPVRFNLLTCASSATALRVLAVVLCLLTAMTGTTVWAGEIYSNGLGGGSWSDGSSWRGGNPPGPIDDVTIARGDTIVFDRDDSSNITCGKLFIDPHGTLTFKAARGRVTMILSDALETYGTIQIDAARVFGNITELRFVGDTNEKRALTLKRGSSLSVIGRRFANPKDASAIISCIPSKEGLTQTSPVVNIVANGHAAIDLRNARFDGVNLDVTGIDNTSAVEGERFNVVGNTFTGSSRLRVVSCDTPMIADNTLINTYEGSLGYVGINVYGCSLPAIRNNHITGTYGYGLQMTSSTDPLIQDNVIENANIGALVQYCSNTMIQKNIFKNCQLALRLYRVSSGVVRDCVFDACKLPLASSISTQQFISNRMLNLVKDQPLYQVSSSKSVFINTSLQPSTVKIEHSKNETLIANQPLVVHVKGKIPAGAMVQVVPVNDKLRWRDTDPPVINSPAPIDLSTGLTPPMSSGRSLLVRAWSIYTEENMDETKDIPVPDYKVQVIGPRSGPKAEAPVLASVTVRPDARWYRADPADTTPTLEITLP